MTASFPTADSLAEIHRGITPSIAGSILEALQVVLVRHHSPPTAFPIVDGDHTSSALVDWPLPDERIRSAHADDTRATEWAAEAMALMTVHERRGLVAIQRAARPTSNDYYVATPGADLEDAVLLEVAGRDDVANLRALLDQKCAQARGNPDRLPAIAVVVRFARPHVMLRDA